MDIKQKVKNMTLEEKIGQKIMLDFRYWDRNGSSNQDMTVPDEAIGKLIADNHVGGVILFANNLKDKQQDQHVDGTVCRDENPRGHSFVYWHG